MKIKKSDLEKLSYEDLEGFDPKEVYGDYPGSLKLSKVQHQILVGKIRNLICDMRNEASEEELIRAIKYSMVAIDARKHRLDYKKAENDFGIPELYRKYHKTRR